MQVFNKLIKVSKASITTKLFDIPMDKFETLSPGEKESIKPLLPSEEEKEFMEVYKANMPQLARLQRKMSVCLDVEVLELEEDKISFEYADSKYTLTSPKNAFKICSALDKDTLSGLAEMAVQGCIFKNETEVKNIKEDGALSVDELRLLLLVADKFFFQTFLVS